MKPIVNLPALRPLRRGVVKTGRTPPAAGVKKVNAAHAPTLSGGRANATWRTWRERATFVEASAAYARTEDVSTEARPSALDVYL